MIIVHTGDGKGKTTAAIGLAVRACGSGLKVLILQFIKGGQISSILPRKKFNEVSKAPAGVNLLPVSNLREALKISMPREAGE